MVNLEELIPLQKNAVLDMSTCTVLHKEINEQRNISRFILEKDRKTFYRVEVKGKVQMCCEILGHWNPWPHITVYSFTPDDLHIYSVTGRPDGIDAVDCQNLKEDQIDPGICCTFLDHVLEYVDEKHLKFDGRIVTVEDRSDFCWKPLKTKILGHGGAKGVYIRLDNIAEEGKFKDPFWRSVWTALFDFYSPIGSHPSTNGINQ